MLDPERVTELATASHKTCVTVARLIEFLGVLRDDLQTLTQLSTAVFCEIEGDYFRFDN
jgi:hypothetical protein